MARNPGQRTKAPAHVLLAALLLVGLSACAEPFEVAPSKEGQRAVPPAPPLPGPLGPFDYDPSPRAIALCYGNLVNNPEQVMAAAQELCPNEGRLQRVHEDFYWNPCALFQPVRVSFVCTPGPPPPPKFQ